MNPLTRLKVQIDGSEKTALVQVIDQKFWCRIDNVTHCFDLSDLNSTSTTRNQIAKTKNSNLITAPMPGKITKIFVQSGNSVEKSEPLLVMEAMKMEYTLKSDLKTTVEKINVKVGDQVTLGYLLIELTPETLI